MKEKWERHKQFEKLKSRKMKDEGWGFGWPTYRLTIQHRDIDDCRVNFPTEKLKIKNHIDKRETCME